MSQSKNYTSTRLNPTYQLVLLAMLTAVLVVLGMVNIPQPAGLSITFNMIPVAIACMALGMKGGLIIGGAFGLISFLQCFGICGSSGMGAALVQVSPFLCFVQRFVSRVLVGLLTACVWKLVKGRMNIGLSGAVTGFCAAFFNTLLFMTSLVLLFGHTEYMQGLIAGRAIIVYIVASVGINAVVEMIVAAVITSAVGAALKKARLIAQ
ncbi:MAG: ECF transporter S component [Clostridia bacterium]|nr:ECF transporter S component [Clostridia bacterium]